MKPIGLVTCYFHHNYGSMLQAYATEMIFQKMNLPYQTISCKSPIVYMQGNKLLYIIKKILIADWKMRIGKIKIEYYKNFSCYNPTRNILKTIIYKKKLN